MALNQELTSTRLHEQRFSKQLPPTKNDAEKARNPKELEEISVQYARIDHFKDAFETLDLITDEKDKESAISQIFSLFAEKMFLESALIFIDSIKDESLKETAITSFFTTLANIVRNMQGEEVTETLHGTTLPVIDVLISAVKNGFFEKVLSLTEENSHQAISAIAIKLACSEHNDYAIALLNLLPLSTLKFDTGEAILEKLIEKKDFSVAFELTNTLMDFNAGEYKPNDDQVAELFTDLFSIVTQQRQFTKLVELIFSNHTTPKAIVISLDHIYDTMLNKQSAFKLAKTMSLV